MKSYRFTLSLLSVVMVLCLSTQDLFAFGPNAKRGVAFKIFERLGARIDQQMAMMMPPSCILLTNTDLNTNLTGWTVSGAASTTDAYAGGRAVELTSSWATMEQIQSGITPGRVYTLSAYAKRENSPTWIVIELQFLNASNTVLSETIMSVTSTTYAEHRQSATAPPNATKVKVLMEKSGSGKLKVDEFCLEEFNPAVGECTLVENSGFENARIGWDVWNTSVTNVTDVKSGASAAQLGSSEGSLYRRLAITPGETYELSAWSKVGSNTDWAEIYMTWKDFDGNTISDAVQPINLSATTYNYYTLKGKAPSTAVYVEIGAYKSSGGSQFVDDFCFKKINALGGTSFDLSCGCSDNMVPNGGYEITTVTSYPYTLDGKPAAAIPNGNNTSLYPWSAGISSPNIFLVNDASNTVNNPEGSRYVWLPNSGDCWTSNTDFSNNLLLEDGETYTFCFYAASRSLTLDGNGLPTGAVPAQSSGILALEFQFVSGFKAVNTWAVPASESATNLSWTKYEYTFIYNILDPISNFTFTNSRWSVGMYIDGVSLSKVNCPAAVTCDAGGLTFDRWGNIAGTSLDDLITNPDYPNNYDETGFLTSFQSPTSNYSDEYGTRVYGYITAPTTGAYQFNITGDDDVILYLSPNLNPSVKDRIAYFSGYTGLTEYTKYSTQTSNTINLVAGQSYYVELLHKEGTGGDFFRAHWKKPGDASWSVIPGTVLRPICSVEVCDNGRDDDFDSLIDCADPDCSNGMSGSYSVVNEGCGVANGSITMSPTGGDTPYSYRWSDMLESAWWTFEETTSDASGNNRNANGITGYPIYTSDAVQGNKSIYFNGSTAIRYSIDNGFMEVAANSLSVSMWIKPDNLSGTKTLFDEGGSSNSSGIGVSLQLVNSTLSATIRRSSSTSYTAGTHTFPNDGNWHHVAMVFNAGKIQVFLDGVAGSQTTSNFTSLTAHSNNGGIAGAQSGSVYNSSSNFYKGKMDDVRYFFNVALTASQIANLASNNGQRTGLSAGTYNVTVASASGCSITQSVSVASGGNYTDGGTISGEESGCGSSFDPQLIGTVTAPSPGSGTTEYKWQVGIDVLGNTVWTDIPGATSATYDPPSIGVTTKFRRAARLTPCTGWVFSNAVTKFTTANYSGGGTIIANESNCGAFDPAVMTGTNPTSGTDVTWKVDPPVSGSANGATYTVTYQNGEPKFLTVTGANVTKVTIKGGTPTATYTTPPFTNLTAPINPNNGQPYGISHFDIWVSGAVNGTTEYKWQQSHNGGTTWEDIASSNSASYNPTTITQTTTYRRGARVAECNNAPISNPYEVEFCTYNLNLIVGESFNIRDYVHYKDNDYASRPIDWSKVFFTYTAVGANDPTTPSDWNLTNFNGGKFATLSAADATNPGNSGTGEYRVYIYRQGQSTFDDHMTIRVTSVGVSDLTAARCTGINDSWLYSNNVTKTVELNLTDPGIIVGDEENCGSFDPGVISSVTTPSGGAGGSLIYQWQLSTNGGATWTDINGAALATLDPITITSTTHYRRGARRSTCSGFVYSNSVVKMVVANFTNPGLITGNESNCTSFNPTIITSTSLPSGGIDGYMAFKWQKSFDGGVTWEDIAGATNPEHDPVVTVTATTLYRRQTRRTPCAAWINSNTIIKEVKEMPISQIEFGPTQVNGYICEAVTYTFQAEDAGVGATYSWNFGSYATPTTATGIGPITVSFNVPNSAAFTTVPVQLTVTKNGCVNASTTNYKVRPPFSVSVSPTNPSSCVNNNGKLTVNVSGPSGTTFEGSINGTTWVAQPIVFNNLGPGNYNVWVRYSGDECQVWWGDQILEESINPNPYFTSWNTTSNCINQIFTVQGAAASGSSVTWDFGPGASPATATGLGPHSVIYSTGGVKTMRISATKNGCTAYEEKNFTVIENYADGGTIGNDESLCANGVPTTMITTVPPAGGYGGSTNYQWEFRQLLGTVWSAWTTISGATGASYTPNSISVNTEYRRRVRRSPCGSWLYSNTVQKSVTQLPGATNDYFDNACPGFTLVGYVGTNDVNLDGPIYSIVSQPYNGFLDMDVDGEFYYIPNTTFCGGDQFTYQVCNSTTGCCAAATAYIDMSDSDAPSLNNIPADLFVSCDDELPLPPVVDAFENCGNVWLAFDETATQGADSCSIYSYLLTRVWTASDYCGNSEIDQQVITIADETAPDIYRIYTLPNGKRMIAGVMENVSQRWKTIAFPVQFDAPPVVLTQVVSKEDNAAVVTRLRNVSTSQFQLRLQEQESADNVHGKESVAWIAIEKGASTTGFKFEAATKLVSSTAVNASFAQSYATPGFIGQIQTFNENNPATLRYHTLNSSGALVFCQEEQSLDPEMNHGFETVGYVAYEGSNAIKNQAGEVIGETGKVTINHNFQQINFAHRYHNPVVVLGGLSMTDPAAATIRATYLNVDGFTVQVDEWDYLDGTHGNQVVHYMVVEGSIPLDQIVECDDIPAKPTLGVEIAGVDNCDISTPLVITDSEWNFDCTNDTTLTRNFYIRDECGNVTSLTQTFILRDTTPPTFTVPSDITITCDEDVNNLVVTGDVTNEHDNCATGLDAKYEDNLSFQNGCSGYVLRIWWLEDHCGNRTTKTQTIRYISGNDTDSDGVPDDVDLDNDNDGIPNLLETSTDSDGDGVTNDRDLDCDNDGITDIIEAGFQDENGDGMVDNSLQLGWDSDSDGYAYGYDANDYNSSSSTSVVNFNNTIIDRDNDTVPNFADLDSDNDGIPDLIEAGGVDNNGDGRIDYPVPNDATTMEDGDSDGYASVYDPDEDSVPGGENSSNALVTYDGIRYMSGTPTHAPDYDADIVPDFWDVDSDNDGIPDLVEGGGVDENGDGRIDMISFEDFIKDGLSDEIAVRPMVITEKDGVIEDGRPEDINNDGSVYEIGDLDNDNILNTRDLDVDGDGISDLAELRMQFYDNNNDGMIDAIIDNNGNGFNDPFETVGLITTDGDGPNNDGVPTDDNDTNTSPYNTVIADGTYGETNGEPDIDDDGDGQLNFMDTDSDNDGVRDNFEDRNTNGIVETGEMNPLDGDSDEDNLLDGVEDTDLDGFFDEDETNPLLIDTDGDLLTDNQEDLNFDGIVNFGESNPRDACDPVLNSKCVGVSIQVKALLQGPMVSSNDDLMRDELRANGYIPTTEPYKNIDLYRLANEGGTEAVSTSLFDVEGENAVVDWMLVELRHGGRPDSIVATRSVLLQRDGDAIGHDGDSILHFDLVRSGDYYVAIRHRNHLGVLTDNKYVLSKTPTMFDFTKTDLVVKGTNARVDVGGGEMALWGGDFNNNRQAVYQGPNNDILELFFNIMMNPGNNNLIANYISNGYLMSDFDLDGSSIYQGPGNDRSIMLLNTILNNNENANNFANYVVSDRLPETSLPAVAPLCGDDKTVPACDFDDDGTINDLDLDDDNDGVTDSDDIGPFNPNSDSDADGIKDNIETHGDARYNPGEDTNPLIQDTDGDGFKDAEEDLNKNGVVDGNESSPIDRCSPNNKTSLCDYDNDGIINAFDLDDDNDGVADQVDVNDYNVQSDTDADGITDGEETGYDGIYHASMDSNPVNPCDPNPTATNSCTPVDLDGDGFYENYPRAHQLFDQNDSNPCVPSSSVQVCPCEDTDGDGKITICSNAGTINQKTRSISLWLWPLYAAQGGVCGPCQQ